MSGICGFIAGPEKKFSERQAVLERMIGTLQHRGAGDNLFFQDGGIALGRRPRERLNPAAPQALPADENGRYRITFDGTVHNHTPLRRELQNRGHLFRTGEDSEVIVHLYEEMGTRCPEKLRGPFAFALWDSSEKALFLARDRFGIKPLYYAHAADGAFLFASEAKALLEYPEISAALNLAALPHYLTFQYFPGPESAFRNIYQLPPAHHLTWSGGESKIRRYWEIRFRPDPKPLPYFVDRAEHLLQESVRLHCGEGAQPGSFLSSGVDSNYLAALLSRRGRLHSYSVNCADSSYDELTPARKRAHLLGAVHREHRIGPAEFWSALPRALRFQDEPVADPAAIALYFAAALAAGEVKAVLSGEGADEVFGGYEIYREPAAVAPLQLLPRPLQTALNRVSEKIPAGIRGKSYLQRATTPLEKRYYGNAFIFSEADKKALLNPELFPGGWTAPWEITAPFYRRSAGTDATGRMQHLDFFTWLPGDILAKADRMTNAHSLEVRLPYLDHRLVEFAATIPPRYRMTRRMTKYVLRMAAARHLPAAVCRRPKLGFPVPLSSWIRNHYRKPLAELWQSEAAQHYFQPRALQQLLSLHCRGRADYARKIWTVAIFLLWHHLYLS
ncbi:MAG: asparagine synthase (glutamine-hydrolyzing) [Firmicutes bacterium]|nr:asparagine synthase (glutamine-hydrolyzing) [Bacillota bacterium]